MGARNTRKRYGGVAELADALDLGSSSFGSAGSTPVAPTVFFRVFLFLGNLARAVSLAFFPNSWGSSPKHFRPPLLAVATHRDTLALIPRLCLASFRGDGQ